jgi:soluble lytic murein transglycosylase-like protein
MQVMPFWVRQIGRPTDNLFHMRTNLRYGCVILRHYLDVEAGDLFRALGRYNGSLGQAEYPGMVVGAWKSNWNYTPPTRVSQN